MTFDNTDGDSFAQQLRAEWTKFWTVRGWVIGMVVAALVIVLLGILYASAMHASCMGTNDNSCQATLVGPGGEAVKDRFYFVHQPLDGNGSITARVTAMTGIITYRPNHDPIISGVVPWAKAGVIVKESTTQGSPYAAIMVTGSQGVRMQHNFTEDTAGRPGGVSAESPRWLRLDRSGDTLTGYESSDGAQWATIGTVNLAGLSSTVQVGLFVASPCDLTVSQGTCRFTNATAVFDQVDVQGAVPGGTWSNDDIGAERGLPSHLGGRVEESGGTFSVTGAGDIAPTIPPVGQTIERTLIGELIGLIVVIVVAVRFGTAEYRQGRATLPASPQRGRVLAAKATVIGGVTFATGLVATAVVIPLGVQILRGNGMPVLPVTALTGMRVAIGSAALLAVAAILAFALGAILRRSGTAIAAAIAVIVLPYVLAVASVLPAELSQWLLQLTPAAGFAIQQSIPAYPQVIGLYTPLTGYYPLAPWAGFAVLCGYTALALGLAFFLQRQRDAGGGSGTRNIS